MVPLKYFLEFSLDKSKYLPRIRIMINSFLKESNPLWKIMLLEPLSNSILLHVWARWNINNKIARIWPVSDDVDSSGPNARISAENGHGCGERSIDWEYNTFWFWRCDDQLRVRFSLIQGFTDLLICINNKNQGYLLVRKSPTLSPSTVRRSL